MDVKLRPDGRQPDEMRPVSFTRRYTSAAPGSVLVEFGNTVVLCTASVELGLPRWRREQGGGGWVTGEYSMLPGATEERSRRERNGAGGRTKEIERLIGRSLRAVTDMKLLGDHSIMIDCDVLQADGGTRTASITGGWLALHDACSWLIDQGRLDTHAVTGQCAAVSVGIVEFLPVLDLPYVEDVKADTDMNVVMTADKFIEVQGTAEGAPFDRTELEQLLALAEKGCGELFAMQQAALDLPA